MPIGGTATDFFADVLPDGFVPEILALVIAAWEEMEKPDQTTLEPRITALLKDACTSTHERLYRDSGFPFRIHHEQKQTDSTSGKEVARTDLEVHVVLPHCYRTGQRPYFIFEAKRLNLKTQSGFQSNASAYVGDDGMMCFVSGKYDIQASFCGMLAYVMDGNVRRARKAVDKAITRTKSKLCLRPPFQITASTFMQGQTHNGETLHNSGNRNYRIFHVFLAV